MARLNPIRKPVLGLALLSAVLCFSTPSLARPRKQPPPQPTITCPQTEEPSRVGLFFLCVFLTVGPGALLFHFSEKTEAKLKDALKASEDRIEEQRWEIEERACKIIVLQKSNERLSVDCQRFDKDLSAAKERISDLEVRLEIATELDPSMDDKIDERLAAIEQEEAEEEERQARQEEQERIDEESTDRLGDLLADMKRG